MQGCVATIGVFDGVHKGHQALIRAAVTHAQDQGARCVMVTFDPHPISVFLPGQAPTQLTSLQQRCALAEELGIDAVLVVNFTRELAGLSPELYVTSLLADTLHATAVFVGENFTFGRGGEANAHTLRELGARHGIAVTIVDLLRQDGQPLCSSLVRDLLAQGDVSGAAQVLGRNYSVTAKIVHGQGRGGAQLGYPTANQYFAESVALPVDGVYAGWVTVVEDCTIDGDIAARQAYPAAISVGTNPTFGDHPRSVESFIIGRDADLYGRTATVEFVEHLRPMVKFEGVDDLLEAMGRDVARAREILGA